MESKISKKVKFSVRTKLIFAFSMPLLALIVTAWINIHQLDIMNKRLNSTIETYLTRQLPYSQAKQDITIKAKEISGRDYVEVKNSIWMVALFFICLTLFALFYIIRSISSPIEKLKDFADNIEKGRLDANVEIEEEDEISSLANSFKNMVKNLVIYVDRMKRLVKIEAKAEVESKRARELEAAYKKLKEMQEMLIQVEKMNAIGQLASGVAHEVRNPLAIITQGIDYLEKKLPLPQEDISETVQTIKENIKRADNIINVLIDFSRTSQLQLKPEDVLSVLESSLALIQHDIRMDGVEIIKELEEGLPKVLADRGKLEQIFINLFLNAIQAMPRDGKIFIRCYTRELDQLKNGIGRRGIDYFRIGERALIIEIEDTGVGISRNNLRRVFEPFFTTKEPGKGTGLGLSVTSNIVIQHRGLIEIESKLHKGTKVILTLKISEGS